VDVTELTETVKIKIEVVSCNFDNGGVQNLGNGNSGFEFFGSENGTVIEIRDTKLLWSSNGTSAVIVNGFETVTIIGTNVSDTSSGGGVFPFCQIHSTNTFVNDCEFDQTNASDFYGFEIGGNCKFSQCSFMDWKNAIRAAYGAPELTCTLCKFDRTVSSEEPFIQFNVQTVSSFYICCFKGTTKEVISGSGTVFVGGANFFASAKDDAFGDGINVTYEPYVCEDNFECSTCREVMCSPIFSPSASFGESKVMDPSRAFTESKMVHSTGLFTGSRPRNL
jgi:hypothetical protein